MTNWAWVVAEPDGTQIADLVAASNRQLSWPIDAAATARWETSGDDFGALAALETATDLLAYRDGMLMFRGRIGTSGDNIDPTKHRISWSAVDYRGMLDRRRIWPGSTTTYTSVDQASIAWDLIADTQATTGGNLGIVNASAATSVLRDRTYDTGKSIGEAVDQLANVIDGFDWAIDPNLDFQVWYPQRGSTVGWVAVAGDTVSQITRTVDTSQFATDVYGTGGDGTTPVARSVSSHGSAGRWETTVSWTDVTVQSTLVELTEAALDQASVIIPSYKATVTPGRWSPSDAWLGDTTRLIVKSGRLDVDTTGRILQVDVTVGDDGDEQAALTFDRRQVTLTDRLRGIQSQLATLSRQ